ncbi:MAG: restriction endonuclease subunit S [Desulfobacterales bacterium]|nr:restriction endonuclease subunit S [Desulfobacterales bacterium]
MAVWSNLNYSEVQEFNRTDAEFYRPEYQEHFQRLKRLGTEKTSHFAYITDGIHASPDIMEGGIRYISAKCVKDNEFIIDNCIHISHRQNAQNPRTQLSAEDVIITTVGTIGNVAVVEPQITPCNCDRHVGIIRIKDNQISPYYLSTFLNSKYGRFQSLRESAGNVQLNLYIKNIGHIEVPRLGNHEEEIASVTKQAYQLRIQSENIYLQAQRLLESKLGLNKLKFKKPVGYTARFSELEQSRRADSEHFYPAFQNLVAGLPNSIHLVPLGPQLNFCQRGKQPLYADEGLLVINSKHVQNNKVVFEDNRSAILGNGNDPQIRYGDILVNGTGRGTLGRAAPYLLENPAIPDNHVTMLRSATLDPAYLSFYLNSQAGQLQVEMHQRGSSGQLELYPFDIRKFLVWVAPESIQKEVRKLYDQAAESERRSKEMLKQTKTRVEKLIEEASEQQGGNL